MPHCSCEMLTRGDGGLAAQRIGKHRLSCLRRTATRQCSSVYSIDNRIKAIRLINVMLNESRISPPMEKQEDSYLGLSFEAK